MTNGWSRADLERIGGADEIEVAPERSDGTADPAVPVWVVRVDDDLYVRSYRGPVGGWYRRARRSGRGRIRVGGIEFPVHFTSPDPSTRQAVDDAYRTKYGRYGSSYVATMTSDAVASTTLQLRPAA